MYEIEKESFSNPWPRAFFESDLRTPTVIALVAEDKTTIVGYSIATYVDAKLHITNIAVDKRCQRQGIATQLMDELERIANKRGCTYAYLEVRTNNLAAIHMYENLGYSILHTRERYYIDGDDAYIMHKELQ